jgi:nucleoside-diphosphate-sugar epimerase
VNDMIESNAAQAAATDKLVPFQRIFLTGGSGYVGRNLVRHFVARGINVTALARSDESVELVRSLGATVVRGDLLDASLSAAMAGCDALIHAAADTDHGPATERQRRVNEDGTRAVIEAARRAGIRKVIHLSTESVLATGRALVNVDETMPLPQKPVADIRARRRQPSASRLPPMQTILPSSCCVRVSSGVGMTRRRFLHSPKR